VGKASSAWGSSWSIRSVSKVGFLYLSVTVAVPIGCHRCMLHRSRVGEPRFSPKTYQGLSRDGQSPPFDSVSSGGRLSRPSSASGWAQRKPAGSALGRGTGVRVAVGVRDGAFRQSYEKRSPWPWAPLRSTPGEAAAAPRSGYRSVRRWQARPQRRRCRQPGSSEARPDPPGARAPRWRPRAPLPRPGRGSPTG
jgi:hypothetical protein